LTASKKIYLVSLGCAKNRLDSEIILGLLGEAGWQIIASPESADLLLVNTCGFIAPASQESIDTILELATHKQLAPEKRLIVTGCLVQRYKAELLDLLPEVDCFIGTNDFPGINEILHDLQLPDSNRLYCQSPLLGYDTPLPRRLTTPFYSAYLKIAEGCSHRCTYCTIPGIRGPMRSRPLESIVQEAELLIAPGVVELNLVAQDTTAYGRDWDGRLHLPELLRRLSRLPGLQWLRLLYSHPLGITSELLEVMAAIPSICPYLDLPLQHVGDGILKRMGRGYGRKEILDTIDLIRRRLPQAALRTSIIVGFPGETEADFQALSDLITEIRFDHLGVFAYQSEEGTPASRLKDVVPAPLARRRVRRLMALQARLSKKNLQRLVGSTQDVLIEGHSPETELLLCGRLARQAPEVDGQVLITAGLGRVGQIQKVHLTHAHAYDLVGEIVE
jgi:ribosomal protein S12 methylthiotransferase